MNTEKKELTDNELIAQFMGYDSDKYKKDSYDTAEFLARALSLPRYDTSWDWLMPVVEKIERLSDVKVTINKSRCRIVAGKKVFSCHTIVKINSMYRVVVEFLRWLNSQPKI